MPSTATWMLACFLGASAITASAQSGPATRDDTRRVVLGASGDLLVHLRVIATADHDARGYDYVLGSLASFVDPEEVAFANLETPLSMERPPETGDPPIMGAPAAVAGALARAGIDVLSIANNHAYDQRATGARATRDALREARIASPGGGPDSAAAFEPTVIERGGLRIAFVAFTEHLNLGPGTRDPVASVAQWDDEAVVRALGAARAQADVVVVSIHWSHDFFVLPSARQRRRARFLVAQGADVILGHGPHVLHSVERLSSARGDALCAYSLGNLLSNQGMRYRAGRSSYPGAHRATYLPGTRDGVWLRLALEVAGDRVRIARVHGIPLFTYNNYFDRFLEGAPEDVRIQRLRDVEDPTLREERRRAIARALGPAVELVD